MNDKLLRIFLIASVVSILSLFLLGGVQAETAFLANPPYPAPGGNQTSDDGGDPGLAGGKTITISDFDFSAFKKLFYGAGRYDPWPTFFPEGPELTMDGSKDILSFNDLQSDFLNGIVAWTGETTVRWLPPTGTWKDSTINTRFTLTITNLNGAPLRLTDVTLAQVPDGIPPELGAVLSVGVDFNANWLFEVEAPDTNIFEPALVVFNRLHTLPSSQIVTSVGGAFYYTPTPFCTGDYDEDGDIDGRDLATQAAGNTAVDLADFAENFGKVDCSLV